MAVGSTDTKEGVKRPLVLVVQDRRDFVPSMLEPLGVGLACQRVGSLRSARRAVAGTSRIVGAVLAPKLPDGSGFELVDGLRAHNPNIPILFVCGECDINVINEAHLAGVPIVARQNCAPNLKHFSMQVQTALACDRDQLASAMMQIAQSNHLSERERQLLMVAVHGIPRGRLALKLGLSENTVKSQIRSLLDKTKKPSLSEVVWLVHRHSESL